MKHVFVVNPCAGGHDGSGELAIKIHDILREAEVYTTVAPRDATRFVRRWLDDHAGEAVRFYACGGDGTLNEVVSGVMAAKSDGRSVEVACYPCGSGDDFVRYWQGVDFTDIAALVDGEAVPVDVMRLGDRYCVNTLNYGFEAEVCHTMATVRRVPLVGGSNMQLMKAESPGPSVGKLVPKVRSTAMMLYNIYFALTVAEFLKRADEFVLRLVALAALPES